MASYSTQKRAQAAIRDVQLGMPVREASRKWTIPRSYLQRRLEGVPTRKEVNQDHQALSPILETQLANWAIGQARLGFAPALVKFKRMAQRLLNASGRTSYALGENWHTRFIERNPAIKVARSKIINYSRVNGATVTNINLFFDRLEAPEIKTIPPDRYYNSDEMGIGQGVGNDHWVVSEASSRQTLKKDVERGEWITAMECISGDGIALPPLLIFKGVNVQSQWFPNNNNNIWNDWRFKSSPNGWTSNQIGLDWLNDIFIPFVRHRHGNVWVVLVCDGHDSHTNDEFLWACLSNKIWLVFYEPHCSHVVQALDVGVFGLLKKKLHSLLRDCPTASLGLPPTKMDVLVAYHGARSAVMTSKTIIGAWRTAGIHPRNRAQALASKYVILEAAGIPKKKSEPGEPSAQKREPTPDFVADFASLTIATPCSGQELRNNVRRLAGADVSFNKPGHRLVARKASKALDLQAGRIASLEAEVDYLKAKLDKTTKKVRQKVVAPPGERFVRMTDVRKAKMRLRSRVIYEDEARDGDAPSRSISAPEV